MGACTATACWGLATVLGVSWRIVSERVRSIEVGRAFVERERDAGAGVGETLPSYRDSLPMSILWPRSWYSRWRGGVRDADADADASGGEGEPAAGGCGSGLRDCLAMLYIFSGLLDGSSKVTARCRITASLLPRLWPSVEAPWPFEITDDVVLAWLGVYRSEVKEVCEYAEDAEDEAADGWRLTSGGSAVYDCRKG